jgi:hypothetical protein
MPPGYRLTDNGSEEQGGRVVERVTERVTGNESQTTKSLAGAQVKFHRHPARAREWSFLLISHIKKCRLGTCSKTLT